MLRTPPTSAPFPYTTLFRSHHSPQVAAQHVRAGVAAVVPAVEPHVVAPGWAELASVVARLRRAALDRQDRKSTRLNSSHSQISYAVFCLKQKNSASSRGRTR